MDKIKVRVISIAWDSYSVEYVIESTLVRGVTYTVLFLAKVVRNYKFATNLRSRRYRTNPLPDGPTIAT